MLAQKMGSQINISESEGEGSLFYFTLKVRYYEDKNRLYNQTLPVKRVMIIDDNDNNRTILEHNFAYWKVDYKSCHSGLEALEILSKDQAFDVVLVDYHMPLLDGFEMVKIVREKLHLDNKKLPVILLHSSIEEQVLRDKCISLNIGYRMTKPIKAKELYNLLLNLFNQSLNEADTNKNNLDKNKNTITDSNNNQEIFKILIADDVLLNIHLVKALLSSSLEGHTFEVKEALNGQEAVELNKNNSFDLIFMDIQMPVKNGYQASEEIRLIEKNKKIKTPIIALTAGALKGEKEKCISHGMDDFLTKPIDSKDFSNILQKYLKSKGVKVKILKEAKNITNKDSSHFSYDSLLVKFDNNSEFVKKLINLSLEQNKKDLKELEKSIVNKEKSSIKLLAHKLKGANAHMTFNNLSDFALKIENEDAENTETLLNLYNNMLEEFAFIIELVAKL